MPKREGQSVRERVVDLGFRAEDFGVRICCEQHGRDVCVHPGRVANNYISDSQGQIQRHPCGSDGRSGERAPLLSSDSMYSLISFKKSTPPKAVNLYCN